MLAAVLHRFGPPEVVGLEDVPRPEPRQGDLLVRVHASTVSIADHRMRSREVPRGLSLLVAPTLGLFRPRVRTLGMDIAGVVEAVGAGVTAFAPGDEVLAVNGHRMGGHAQYAIVRADGVVAAKPVNLSFEDSVALVFGGTTAIVFLRLVPLGSDTTVLVNGASGAVGSLAVQLAARTGARVTAVCSGANADLVRSLGADHVIDYTREDFTAGDVQYDVIVECVGNAPFSRVRHLVRPGGALRQVIIASAGALLAGPLQSRRAGFLVTNRNAPLDAGVLRELVALAQAGEIRPVVDRVYDLVDIVEAHRYVDTGRKRGNVVLRIP
jgi:NADPH:quinone reductase-like Zn-dependent oxidoreductase